MLSQQDTIPSFVADNPYSHRTSEIATALLHEFMPQSCWSRNSFTLVSYCGGVRLDKSLVLGRKPDGISTTLSDKTKECRSHLSEAAYMQGLTWWRRGGSNSRPLVCQLSDLISATRRRPLQPAARQEVKIKRRIATDCNKTQLRDMNGCHFGCHSEVEGEPRKSLVTPLGPQCAPHAR